VKSERRESHQLPLPQRRPASCVAPVSCFLLPALPPFPALLWPTAYSAEAGLDLCILKPCECRIIWSCSTASSVGRTWQLDVSPCPQLRVCDATTSSRGAAVHVPPCMSTVLTLGR